MSILNKKQKRRERRSGQARLFARSGQALAEVLIGLGVGAIILGSVAGVMRVSTLSNKEIKESKTAAYLARDQMENVRAFSISEWSSFYQLDKGASSHYYVATSTPFVMTSGDESITLDSVEFTRFFYIENVSRSDSTDAIITSGGTQDVLTQKITSKVTWANGNGEYVLTEYISVMRNFVLQQSNWSGELTDGPITFAGDTYSTSTAITVGTDGSFKLEGY